MIQKIGIIGGCGKTEEECQNYYDRMCRCEAPGICPEFSILDTDASDLYEPSNCVHRSNYYDVLEEEHDKQHAQELEDHPVIERELWSEAGRIVDKDIRMFTLSIIDNAPIKSWKLPSSRDHHLPDECEEWGNLLHTVRVVRIVDTLTDLFNLNQHDKDILKSAALLHDCCKHGVSAEAVFIYRDHNMRVEKLIEKLNGGIDTAWQCQIISIIQQHMGRWGNVPCDWSSDRSVTLPLILHIADCVEADLPSVVSELANPSCPVNTVRRR